MEPLKQVKYISEISINGLFYQKILNRALEVRCTAFEFCLRNDIGLMDDKGRNYEAPVYELIAELAPFLISKKLTNEWGMTTVFSQEKVAELHRYQLTEASVAILLNYSESLTDWCWPKLPEDISFFQEEKPWLEVVGHEATSYWFITKDEKEYLETLGILFI